jgi:hypothetical protein
MLLGVAAWLTGFAVYNQFDGRFGRLSVWQLPDSIDLHGTLALGTLVIFSLLALYSLTLGRYRLFNTAALEALRRSSSRQQQLSWLHLSNTLALFGGVLAVLSGRMMQEDWLEKGQLSQFWYSAHLLSWVLLGLVIIGHVLSVWMVGGWPLIRAMFSAKVQRGDRPSQWWQQIRNHWRRQA